MVRFTTASRLGLLWAGTLGSLGAVAFRLDVPQGAVTIGVPVPITWTREVATDPAAFGIMQSLQTGEIIDLFPVQNPSGALSGTVLMTFGAVGQILLAPVLQLRLGLREAPTLLSTGIQVPVVQDGASSSGSSSPPPTSSSSSQPPTSSPKPTSTSTEVFTPPPPTQTSSSTSSIFSSSQSSIISFQVLTATQLGVLPSTSSSSLSPLPSSKISAATGGISGSKKIIIVGSAVGAVIGLLLCILLGLHIQRRKARKRLRDFADTLDRRYSMSPSIRDFQASSAVSSFSAGLSHIETRQNQTPLDLEMSSAGRYPFADAIQSENQSRVPPPISIPQTYLTPPSPYSGVIPLPDTAADTSSPYTAYSPHSPYSPMSHSMRSPAPYSPSSPYSSSQSSSAPFTPLTPSTSATPQRSMKMREVAELQAQRKLLREERQSRLTPMNGNAERDSWSMILNDEPLPRYVSPAASVRLLH